MAHHMTRTKTTIQSLGQDPYLGLGDHSIGRGVFNGHPGRAMNDNGGKQPGKKVSSIPAAAFGARRLISKN